MVVGLLVRLVLWFVARLACGSVPCSLGCSLVRWFASFDGSLRSVGRVGSGYCSFLVRFKCCSLDSMVVGSVSCNGVVLCCSRLRLATSESSFVYFIGFGINKIVAVKKKMLVPNIAGWYKI